MELKPRQKRNKGWFVIDNEFIDRMGKFFGPTGTAVYMALARHADVHTQKCFPSQRTVAHKIHSTDRTVRDYIQALIRYRVISCAREKRGGRWLNNVYTLLDRTGWITPEEVISSGNKKKLFPVSAEIKTNNQQRLSPSNETHRKESHIKNKNEENCRKIRADISKLTQKMKIGS